MGITIEEQETVIQFSRNEKTAKIYTTDKTVITKLDKIYRVVNVLTEDGEEVGKEYEVDKRSISFRMDKSYTPENVQPKRHVDLEHIKKMTQKRRQKTKG